MNQRTLEVEREGCILNVLQKHKNIYLDDSKYTFSVNTRKTNKSITFFYFFSIIVLFVQVDPLAELGGLDRWHYPPQKGSDHGQHPSVLCSITPSTATNIIN